MEYPPIRSVSEDQKDYVVLHGIDDTVKTYLVKDSFLNRSPRLSPHGKLVAFVSARQGNPTRLKLLGELAPREIYGYDLVNNKIVKLISDEVLDQIGNVNSIECASRKKGLFCLAPSGNKIWFTLIGKDSLENLRELDSLSWISSISISPDDEYLLFSYLIEKESPDHEISMRAGSGILNITTQKVDYMQAPLGEIGGWTIDGKSFLHRDTSGTWGTYDLKSKEFFPIKLSDTLKNYHISELQFWNKDTLIFIGEKIVIDRKEGPEDIYLYSIKNEKLKSVTNDGIRKSDLTFHNKYRE